MASMDRPSTALLYHASAAAGLGSPFTGEVGLFPVGEPVKVISLPVLMLCRGEFSPETWLTRGGRPRPVAYIVARRYAASG